MKSLVANLMSLWELDQSSPYGLVEPFGLAEVLAPRSHIGPYWWLAIIPSGFGLVACPPPQTVMDPRLPLDQLLLVDLRGWTSSTFEIRSHLNYLFREAKGHISKSRLCNTL